MFSILLTHTIKYEFDDLIIIYKCGTDYINYIKALITHLSPCSLPGDSSYAKHDRVYKSGGIRG